MEFKMPHFHGKSTKLDWVSNDTKEEFEKHLQMYPDSKHLNSYKKNPIEYKLNNYGFRTDDDFYDRDTGTVYLGCSHTFGNGHHLENIWSYKLHQKIGEGKFFNLSCPGTGITSHYYFLKYFSKKLKFKKVYHYYPSEIHYRYGFMNRDGKLDIYAAYSDGSGGVETELWQKYLSNHHYNNFHQLVYMDAIKNLCREIGCEYHLCDVSHVVWRRQGKHKTAWSDPYHTKYNPARDLIHHYAEKHDSIVEFFSKKPSLI